MSGIFRNYSDGIDISSPYAGTVYEPTADKKPATPFPGVAPVSTIRRQVDGSYDQGLDMEDGRGCAKNFTQLGIGEGGKLAVDPGMHTSGDAPIMPPDAAFWGVPAPIRRKKRG